MTGTEVPLYRRAIDLIDAAARLAVIALMAAMVAIVSAQVFYRYILNSSIDWAEEVSRLTFVWSIFMALPLGLRAGAHIGVELVTERLPPALRDVLFRIGMVASGLMLALVAREAWGQALENWDETIPGIGLSGGLFFLAVAVGAAHSVLHVAALAYEGPGGIVKSAPGATE